MLEAEWTSGPSAAGKIRYTKKIRLIGSRTRDLPLVTQCLNHYATACPEFYTAHKLFGHRAHYYGNHTRAWGLTDPPHICSSIANVMSIPMNVNFSKSPHYHHIPSCFFGNAMQLRWDDQQIEVLSQQGLQVFSFLYGYGTHPTS
jgi:hypothetical protein